MILVGISGKAHSGKTTLVNYLARKYNWNEVSFAVPVKEMAKREFGLTEYQVNGAGKDEYSTEYFHSDGVTPYKNREILQWIGMAFRAVDPLFWVKKAQPQMREGRINIISDTRLKNEADWIKKQSGFLVRLNRSESLTGPYIDHVSETDLDAYGRFDIVIPETENIGPTDIPLMADKVQKLVMGNVNAQSYL